MGRRSAEHRARRDLKAKVAELRADPARRTLQSLAEDALERGELFGPAPQGHIWCCLVDPTAGPPPQPLSVVCLTPEQTQGSPISAEQLHKALAQAPMPCTAAREVNQALPVYVWKLTPGLDQEAGIVVLPAPWVPDTAGLLGKQWRASDESVLVKASESFLSGQLGRLNHLGHFRVPAPPGRAWMLILSHCTVQRVLGGRAEGFRVVLACPVIAEIPPQVMTQAELAAGLAECPGVSVVTVIDTGADLSSGVVAVLPPPSGEPN